MFLCSLQEGHESRSHFTCCQWDIRSVLAAAFYWNHVSNFHQRLVPSSRQLFHYHHDVGNAEQRL